MQPYPSYLKFLTSSSIFYLFALTLLRAPSLSFAVLGSDLSRQRQRLTTNAIEPPKDTL